MAEKLTNEQQAAVDSRERSLLVSAAAGSGKTKVLVERLFSYVEREGANLDDFLIITYTRAAASELRGKIAKALTERMERDPGNYHLRQQMLRVYRADIKTVDAFCTALLRENCHLLGEDARGHALRPDFRVLDENEAQVLRERVLARTLDDFYDCLTPGGTLLADTLGAGRDDSALEDLVLELHAKLQAQPYEDKWLEAQRAFWRAVPDKIEDTPYGKILLNEVRRKARHCKNLLQRAAQEMCANDALNQKYAPAFLDASYQLEALEGKTAEGWDAARGVPALCGLPLQRFKLVGRVEERGRILLVQRVIRAHLLRRALQKVFAVARLAPHLIEQNFSIGRVLDLIRHGAPKRALRLEPFVLIRLRLQFCVQLEH